eukprot:Tbor_TRINITY_DN3210_c0_g1::TRINITY_DN3210_c0_g1_i1::g.23749::m.23749
MLQKSKDTAQKKPKKGQVIMTEEQINEEVVKAKLRRTALKACLAERMDETAAIKAAELELAGKHDELETAYKELVVERFDIISDFTRQHKSVEDELISRITLLDSTITDLRDQKELSILAFKETVKEREHYIALKQREFEEQEKKMREMEEEFAQMLSETQNKMTKRVESTLMARTYDDEDSLPDM